MYGLHFVNYVKSPDRKLQLEDKHFEAVDWSSACRTDKLGRLLLVCEDCGEVSYMQRSCKHRFCGQCGACDTHKWAERMLTRLLNIKHHHITMTLPKAYRGLSKKNGNKLHDILFKSSSQVIQDWFGQEHNLRVGIVSVLHTSGSDLKYHPHVHMIVSRGGQDLRSGEYIELEGDYLVKNEELGKLIKKRFNELLLKAYRNGELKVYRCIEDELGLKSWISKQKSLHWIVDIQKPMSDIAEIIGYVGRYTKRACISEYKLSYVGADCIKFKYKDYKNSKRGEAALEVEKVMKPIEFLDSLLQHVPSKRYRMVRYCGLYNTYYLKDIPEIWRLKDSKREVEFAEDYDWGLFERYRKAVIRGGGKDPFMCEHCDREKIVYGLESKGRLYVYSYDSS